MSVSIPAKSTDGTVSTRQRQISRQIYVSSQGRLFVKIFRRARGGASDSAVGPGEGGANLHFAGNKLVGTLAVVSAGRTSLPYRLIRHFRAALPTLLSAPKLA